MPSRSKMRVFAALAASTISAHAAPPIVYDCKWGDETARLNFTDHIATFAGKHTELGEGIFFGFRTPDGARVVFDVKFAMDVIHEHRPPIMSGVATITKDHEGPPIPVHCALRR